MAVPGALMRLVQPKTPGQPPPDSVLTPTPPFQGVEATYVLGGTDGQPLSNSTVYILEDIAPLVESAHAYEQDVKAHDNDLASISWVVCAFINGRDKVPSEKAVHGLPSPPQQGSIVVINGSTPRPEKEQDYHDWYDQEHGGKLTLVPGWNAARRYKLAKSYGPAETASFYGFNYYDEVNGLGGPEWKAGVTEWSLRIRSNAAKPNIRRVWKVVSTSP